jgi:hypothetical protein
MHLHILPVSRLLLLTAGLEACSFSQIPTLKEYGEGLIGQNVSVIRGLTESPNSYATRIGWQEKTYPLPNGYWVYVQPDRPNCEIHFEVNGEDIIVGYTPVGRGCKHQ